MGGPGATEVIVAEDNGTIAMPPSPVVSCCSNILFRACSHLCKVCKGTLRRRGGEEMRGREGGGEGKRGRR